MLTIYQYPTCPYCVRVLTSLDKMNLVQGKDYQLVDASWGTPGRDELQRLGGRNQVPFLVDGDIKMYESMDIIHYILKKTANS